MSSWLLFKLSIFLRLKACNSTCSENNTLSSYSDQSYRLSSCIDQSYRLSSYSDQSYWLNTWNSHISPSSFFSVVRICGKEMSSHYLAWFSSFENDSGLNPWQNCSAWPAPQTLQIGRHFLIHPLGWIHDVRAAVHFPANDERILCTSPLKWELSWLSGM